VAVYPNDDVSRLCRLIHPSNEPCYVEVRRWPHARESQCFVNVRERVDLEGGKIQYGWALWQPSGAFLAAEHHAVYEPQSGPPWVDITPRKSVAIRILFLPDEGAVYKNKLVDNKRLPLVDDGRVREFIRLNGEYIGVENSIRGASHLTLSAPEQLEQRSGEIKRRIDLLKVELDEAYPLPYLGPNDPCFCGSLKRYEKCRHGQQ